MKMALDNASGVNTIRSYEAGRVQIRERFYTNSLIVLPSRLYLDWEPGTVQELRTAHLAPILEERPEVLIIGTGETQVFPEPAIFSTFMDLGIGFEIMDNAAACRTFNVLLAENRRAALALVMEGDA